MRDYMAQGMMTNTMAAADMQDVLLPPQEWANYGLHQLIYIKAVMVEDHQFHALYAADGTQLVMVEARALAEATIRQHALQALSVH
jgi:hypothetical protein